MFPLPVPHEKRTDPLDFIPEVTDTHGRGERMWRVMANLKITQGKLAGERLGMVAPPWQERWIRTLYGHTAEDGAALFREAFLMISKKQGKSTISGMLGIAHCVAFPEERGSVIIMADSKEQAHLVYDSMASTVEADPWLASQFHVRRYRSDLIHRATNTHLKAVASELAAVVGQIPSMYIVDELHLLGLKPKGGQLVRQLSSGIAVRENGLGIYITTAPVGVASGIYTSTYNRARRILEGEGGTDRMFPVVFQMPDDCNPDDKKYWWMPNPSLDYTISKQWFHEEHANAKADPDPGTYANFLSQHLNIHAQELIGVDRWIPTDVWDAFADETVTLERIIDEADTLYLSMDAGYRFDPSAAVVLGHKADGTYLLWSHQWIHADGYNTAKDHIPYDEFVESGVLTVGETENADVVGLFSLAERLYKTGKLSCVGVDPAKLQSIIQMMEDAGMTVVAVKQGWQLNPHLIATERLIYNGGIVHSGSPMLRWNFSNALLSERGMAKALVKPSGATGGGGYQKIDGVVCVVMAVAVASDPENAPGLIGSGELLMLAS